MLCAWRAHGRHRERLGRRRVGARTPPQAPRQAQGGRTDTTASASAGAGRTDATASASASVGRAHGHHRERVGRRREGAPTPVRARRPAARRAGWSAPGSGSSANGSVGERGAPRPPRGTHVERKRMCGGVGGREVHEQCGGKRDGRTSRVNPRCCGAGRGRDDGRRCRGNRGVCRSQF